MACSQSDDDEFSSQSLPAVVEALDLNNHHHNKHVDTEGTVDKYTVKGAPVTTNELQLTINHCEDNKSSTSDSTDVTITATSMACGDVATSNIRIQVTKNDKDNQVVMLPGN